MRKIAIVLLFFSVAYVSCDDLVEEEVFSVVTPNNFFQNEQDVATAVNGVYDGIQDSNIWWRSFYWSEMAGGLLRHQWRPWAETLVFENDDANVWNLWRLNYVAIGRANAVINVLESSSGIDEDTKNRYAAEARFIRAYVYFNQVRLFGHIPLVKNPPASIADAVTPAVDADLTGVENEFLNQVDASEVYDFIVQDLEFAEANLPSTHPESDLGRVTSGSAKGMLARVYLAMAGMSYDYNTGQLTSGDASMYALAASKSAELMNSSYRLLDDYGDIFDVGNNDEVLFAIQYVSSADAGVTGEGSQINARTGIRGASDFTPLSWFQCSVNETFIEDFIDNNSRDDKRFERTFLEYYVNTAGDTIRNGSSNTFARPMLRKFLTDIGPEPSAQDATDFGNDWVVLRYADVLLMNSEALNESGATPDASTINGINQVRARAGKDLVTLPISKEDLREAIWEERKWELCYEGVHYFDSQRTGRLLDEIEKYPHPRRLGTPSLRHYINPIPFNAIQANNSLQQNSGW